MIHKDNGVVLPLPEDITIGQPLVILSTRVADPTDITKRANELVEQGYLIDYVSTSHDDSCRREGGTYPGWSEPDYVPIIQITIVLVFKDKKK